MTADPLGKFDKRRLRCWLVLFFLALAIPTAVLIAQAWRQLKWESFHRHSQSAAALATQIDQRTSELLRREDQRPFSDYVFLSAAGTSNLLQRSPLAQFPVERSVPGLVGYFQVDNTGQLSSPLLPQNLDRAGLGIAEEQWQQRQQVHDSVRELLIDNALVERSQPVELGNKSANELAGELSERFGDSAATVGKLELDSAPASAPAIESRDMVETVTEEPVPGRRPATSALSAPSVASEVGRANKRDDADFGYDAKQADNISADAQRGFDELNKAPAAENPPAAAGYRQTKVSELELDDRLQARKQSTQQLQSDLAGDRERRTLPAASEPADNNQARAKRKEQVYLPDGGLQSSADELSRASTIQTFESELDPFEFSLLNSGHFVLYRKVWRDDLRFVQGALIERDAFVRELIETPFRNSALADNSDLVVAFQGDVLTLLGSGGGSRRYLSSADQLSGTLLHRRQLTPPLAGLELLFSANRLPAGAGAGVLGWSAAILSLVLCGGLFGLYRVGLRQITLAHQQQDFVSAVSHELKTPLTSIRMYSEMLREGWTDETKKRSYYDFIHDESERLSRLIENVLQLARMTRNEMKLNIESVSVALLLDMLRSKVASAMNQAGYELIIDCPAELAERNLKIDLDCLAQVFINLIDNALKFSTSTATRQVDLTVSEARGAIQFGLRDYGPGIDKNQMKKIFRLFYRPKSELTRETAGTGIGLALVHQLVQAMDGKIDVRNRNPGAEFLLRFPG